MPSQRCSFCNHFSSQNRQAVICDGCAEGRSDDRWCDFCRKTTVTDIAWICRKCAEGKVGDGKCDFCGKRPGNAARICGRCP